ncbi:glycosyltransferase family protein [Alkaliphilus hydrothermalis]|uniref:Spore maturation protein CgeB n=1 Tax=Alkaliphilus hydrothermalis TaxID=1482730 RepID=A0ABS2NRL6_9FIRM|nr:glycosyltransferase [Alkaliphilus hydrothermalis]MBM7615471.1 spore maturation protein CgeB [Alkaliphilus hydrothermalis]
MKFYFRNIKRFKKPCAKGSEKQLPLKIACILDEFSHECFKHECILIPLKKTNWQKTLTNEKPHMLLVESAWMGNDGSWRYQISNLQDKSDKPLEQLIRWCRFYKIPTVFWNKEDPLNFQRFISAAKLFDYVFTTDSHCIPKYMEILGHNRIYSLPFAAQPKIHNPINKNKTKLGEVAFAGTWYNTGHEERVKQLEMMLKPALNYDLHIYDRMNNFTQSDHYKFPHVYQPHIKGSLAYDEMTSTYKKYPIFLNVNSCNQSPTMFSRRVFELLACGTNVISSYSVGIDEMFSGIVHLSQSEAETISHLELLINDQGKRDQYSLIGIREVLKHHTYKHRLNQIVKKVMNTSIDKEEPLVSIVMGTNRQYYMDNVFSNFDMQNYKNKEMIVVLNDNRMDLKLWKNRAKKYKNVMILQLDEAEPLGACLNLAISKANGDIITKFDDDNYYAPEYLGDLLNAFKYTDADIVGKGCYYIYFEGLKTLGLKFEYKENQYTKFVAGSTITGKKHVFDKVKFVTDRQQGSDSQFLQDCSKQGFKIYSTDRFNHVVCRRASLDDHTWKINDEEHLKKCKIITENTDDYTTPVTV